MNATEELQRLLDERGIHWWAGADDHKTLWESNGLTWEYFNDENGDAWLGFLGACEQDITPEQAIAATIGGRKLTAKQVCEAVYANSIHADCADANWQAIADELNAVLGGGECEDVSTKNGIFKCSECGCTVEEYGVDCGEIHYCPDCGKAVKR